MYTQPTAPRTPSATTVPTRTFALGAPIPLRAPSSRAAPVASLSPPLTTHLLAPGSHAVLVPRPVQPARTPPFAPQLRLRVPALPGLQQQAQTHGRMQHIRAQALVDLAHKLRQAGKTTEAIGMLQNCLRKHPNHKEALVPLAELLLKTGDYPQAQALFAQAAQEELDGSQQGQLGVGMAHLLQGQYFAAATAYNACLQANPMLLEAHLGFAMSNFKAKNFSAAECSYGTALRIAPENLDALSGRALCLLQLEYPALAKKAFEAVLQIDPLNLQGLEGLAYVLRLLGDEIGAQQALEKFCLAALARKRALEKATGTPLAV